MSKIILLLPALTRCGDSKLLSQWIVRGTPKSMSQSGRRSQLRELFQFSSSSIPVAALTRQLDCGDADSHVWLRADPAFVRADMVAVRLLACGNMQLTLEETKLLSACLEPLFQDNGFYFEASKPNRWYVRCPDACEAPEFAIPNDVLGNDLSYHLPTGELGRRWRGLLNEAQILLHNHPLNIERIERGKLSVNSLWFWGEGKLPNRVTTSAQRILSNDEIVQALAFCAVIPYEEISSFQNFPASNEEQILLDLVEFSDTEILEHQWLIPLDKALRTKQCAEIDLMFASGERIQVCRGDRWRVWRGVRVKR